MSYFLVSWSASRIKSVRGTFNYYPSIINYINKNTLEIFNIYDNGVVPIEVLL